MEPTNRTPSPLAPFALALFALAAPGVAQVPVVEDLLWTAADAQPGDQLGLEVAADGDRVVVSELAGGTTRVLVRSGGTWVQEFDTVGAGQVALSGDLMAVGGWTAGNLIVKVYERGVSGWHLDFWMPDPGGGTTGPDIALVGERLLVGLPSDDALGTNVGTAYLYERVAGTWTLVQQFFPPVTDSFQRFGWPVALGADFALVGASNSPWATNRLGQVHVFELQGTTWTHTLSLRNPNAQVSSGFPGSIAADGERVVVGDPGSLLTGTYGGAVHLYERAAGAWTYLESILPPDPDLQPGWGTRLDLHGGRLLVGAAHTHRAATWVEGPSGWEPEALLLPGGSWSDDPIVPSVALGDDHAVIADTEDDTAQPDGGALRVYTLPPVAVGTLACVGGAALPCPCGNAPGDTSASGCRNTTGEGARLVASGGDSLAADDLVLSVHGLPEDEFLILWAAPGPAVPLPADGGVGCLGPGAVFVQHGPTTLQSFGPGLGATLGALPGETWFFQVAYRDHLAGPCALVNWSPALGTTFAP